MECGVINARRAVFLLVDHDIRRSKWFKRPHVLPHANCMTNHATRGPKKGILWQGPTNGKYCCMVVLAFPYIIFIIVCVILYVVNSFD